MANEDKKAADKTCKFLVLPECVLRVLFSYLDSTTLYQLTRTCRYFQYFITDPVFWKYIDARKNPNTTDKVRYCCDRIHERTTHVLLKAKDKVSGLVPYNFFKIINPFKNIKVLALEKQRFHGSKLTLKDFPPCLEELSLKGTRVQSSTFFFQHSGQNMQKLRVLILDQCQWVTCSFLMSVAKYESLEIISAVKCLRLHLNMVPYLNVARYGCKKLKIFDCRFTGIGHDLLRTFYPKESLQSLYFQSVKSAEIDFNEYIFNRPNETMEQINRNQFFGSHSEVDGSISDKSLFEYVHLSAHDLIEKIPESILYKDPYPDCTCGPNRCDESNTPPLVYFDEYHVCTPPRRKSIKLVCQRHVQDVEKLSDHFREFFLSNQHQYYSDFDSSEVESELESSDSEEENCNNCCMYGLGRNIILLTQATNSGPIQEEVLELNHNREHEPSGRVISLFISTRSRQNSNNDLNAHTPENNANPTPSTSGTVQEASGNQRKESKRKLSEDKELEEPQHGKRPKTKEDLKQMSDEAKSAEASELIASAGKMGETMNEFVRSSMKICGRSNKRDESEPTTSRVRDADVEMGNVKEPQGSSSKTADPPPSVFKADRNASTSSNYQLKSVFEIGNSSGRQPHHHQARLQLHPRIYNPSDVSSSNSGQNCPNSGAEEGESSRQGSANASRTVLFTIRSRERSRFENPLLVQLRNRLPNKKSRLRRLSLRGFRNITNVALDYIKNLKLDLIDLTYTSVTKEGIENFLAYNPNCRVVHPLYCICKPLNPL